MGLAANNQSQKYFEISCDSLMIGALVDRPLYIYLPKNEKYICILNAFHPIDSRIHSKLLKSGRVFSTLDSAKNRYPEIIHHSQIIRELCQNQELTHFEKNLFIFKALQNILETFIKDTSTHEWDPTATESGLILNDTHAAAIFITETFQAPIHGSLEYLENLSIECFNQGLIRAVYAGIFALLLEYTDYEFIRQYCTAVFYDEVRRWVKLDSEIPEFKKLDKRFQLMVSNLENLSTQDDRWIGAYNDELKDLVEYTRWLQYKSDQIFNSKDTTSQIKKMPSTRVFKKIRKQLSRIFSVVENLNKKVEAA